MCSHARVSRACPSCKQQRHDVREHQRQGGNEHFRTLATIETMTQVEDETTLVHVDDNENYSVTNNEVKTTIADESAKARNWPAQDTSQHWPDHDDNDYENRSWTQAETAEWEEQNGQTWYGTEDDDPIEQLHNQTTHPKVSPRRTRNKNGDDPIQRQRTEFPNEGKEVPPTNSSNRPRQDAVLLNWNLNKMDTPTMTSIERMGHK